MSCGCAREPESPPAVSTSAAAKPAAILDAPQLRNAGLAALETRDLDKADELARAAIAVSPSDPENIFLLAIVLAEQNRFAEAIKRLEDLAEKAPSTRLPVLGQTAAWMVEQGQWLDAEQRCIEILTERPDAIPVHRLLVQLYTRQGRRLDAANHLRQLCRLGNVEEPELQALVRTFYSFAYGVKEEEYEPIGELGIAHYEISAGDWDAAATTLDQVPDRNPAESALRGRILIQQQRFDLLSQWATDVPDSAKVTADYWFAMGVHQARQGDHISAIKSFCATVVRDQTDEQAYSWMSRSLAAINADAQAKEAAKRAELIQRTQLIASELAATPHRDLQKMTELVDLLDALQRPFEALSWRAVLLIYAKSNITDLQAKQMLDEINQSRIQLLQSNQPEASRGFVLCGVTPEILGGSDRTSGATEGNE